MQISGAKYFKYTVETCSQKSSWNKNLKEYRQIEWGIEDIGIYWAVHKKGKRPEQSSKPNQVGPQSVSN